MRAHHIQVLPASNVRDANSLTADVDLGSVPLNDFRRGKGEDTMFKCLRNEIVRRDFGTCSEHNRLLPICRLYHGQSSVSMPILKPPTAFVNRWALGQSSLVVCYNRGHRARWRPRRVPPLRRAIHDRAGFLLRTESRPCSSVSGWSS